MNLVSREMERHWSEFSDHLGEFLRRRVPAATEAEDIRQDLFVKLQEHLQAGNTIQNIRAWLYQSAKNAVIDHYRMRKSRVDIRDDMLIVDQPNEPELAPLIAAFRRMIDALPDGYREAVLLADIEQLPHQVVAKKLGLSLSATKSRVLRGRRMLRESLDRCCQFERDGRGSIIDCTPKTKGNCVEC